MDLSRIFQRFVVCGEDLETIKRRREKESVEGESSASHQSC